MASGLRNRRHQELPDLFGQRAQLRLAERANVRRTRDPVEYRATGDLVHIPLFESSEEPAVLPNSMQRAKRRFSFGASLALDSIGGLHSQALRLGRQQGRRSDGDASDAARV